jgi:hypothetical protein
MCYAGVAITGSRGGYLSTAFSIVVFAVISLAVIRKGLPHRYPGALIGAIVAIVLVITGAVFLMNRSTLLQTRLSTIPQQFDTKKQDVRIYNWQEALDHFRVAPLVGTGAGTHLYYGRLFRRPQLQADPIHAHCDYLELIAEYGIVAAVGMAAFLFVHIRHGFRTVSALIRHHLLTEGRYHPIRGEALALQIGALSAVGAYLAHSAVDFNLHIPGNALLFAFIFGVLANPNLTQVQVPASGWLGAFRVALPALGALMAAVGLTKWPGEYWCEQARVALRKREFDGSIRLGEKALTLEKRNPDLYFHLAGAYAGRGITTRDETARAVSFDAAEGAARRGLAIFPHDEHAMIRLAQILRYQGRYQEAGETFRKALELDPNLAILHAIYARHLASVGRLEDAKEELAISASLASLNVAPFIEDTPLNLPGEPEPPPSPK